MSEKIFRPGEILVNQGELNNNLYILNKGSIEYYMESPNIQK